MFHKQSTSSAIIIEYYCISGLFSHPGEESESEDLVDGEVQIGGVLQRAETLLLDQEQPESP